MKTKGIRNVREESLQRRIAILEAEIARCSEDDNRLRKQLLALKKRGNAGTNEETIRDERLHALGRMASGIVHEFNNSLTPILGASEFLLANPHVLSRQADALALLQSVKLAAHDAKNIVLRLREFYSPQQDADISVVDVNSLIEECLMLTRPKWREQAGAANTDVRIRKDLAEGCIVRIKASDLREVVTNLIINATDAIKKMGTITVSTRLRKGRVIIRIRDTGYGMTRDVREHCFDPFFSTKGKDGTGLGLSVTHGIVHKHGGTIRVAASASNKGTTMEVQFPVADTVEPKATIEEPTPGNVPRLKVLVCENDLMTRRAMAKYLRSDGHNVHLATAGRNVPAKIRAGSFDIVILDALMPSGIGTSMPVIVRKGCPSCAIILAGGLGCKADVRKLPDGVFALLDKPFTQRDLRIAVAKAHAASVKTTARRQRTRHCLRTARVRNQQDRKMQ